ncbi:MAG: sporulation protein YqfD [Ruminococcus sp.]|nr:sporulation protein YqfD [Ruminococcus sp.]
MKKRLRGAVRITAEGKEQSRFINAIHTSGLSCYEQYSRGEAFCCEINRSDLDIFLELAESCGMTVSYKEYPSLSLWLSRRKKRFGVIAGLLLLLAAVILFSGTVTEIELRGNDRIADDTLLSALAEAGICPGAYIHDIDFVLCENRLQTEVAGIAWIGMQISGSRIVVEIREETPEPDILRSRIPCNIVARYDSEIVYTSVLDGRLMHKVGDFVPAGTMIVSGVTTDATGHTTLHHAMGSITGIYTDTVSFTADESLRVWNETGNSHKRRRLRIFSLDIPISLPASDSFGSSVLSREEDWLEIGEKRLPIGMMTETENETALTEITLTAAEQEEQTAQKIFLYEKNFLADTEILEREIERSEEDGVLTLTVTYTLRGEIGEQREILMK